MPGIIDVQPPTFYLFLSKQNTKRQYNNKDSSLGPKETEIQMNSISVTRSTL